MTITDQSRALVLPELVEASEDRRRRRGRGGSGGAGRDQRMPLAVGTTGVLLLGALYCLLPVAWVVIASTKDASELFSTFTFAP